MRNAEHVTFGGSGLDRAAELRGDIPALAKIMQAAETRTVLMWKGKPLVTGDADSRILVRLPLDHPILKEARSAPILLGREDGAARFAHDISDWVPDTDVSAVGAFIDTSVQSHPSLPEDHGFAELRSIMTHLSPRDAELAATAKAIIGWHETHGFCARCGSESDVTQAGWQRVCQACGASHFPRTDPVVIMLITHGNKVLLGRSPGWPEGMYSCLAGFVEPGETIEAAVRREVWEEAGVRVGEVQYLSSQPWPFPASLMFGCHGIALSEEINIDPQEIEDALWVSREEVMDALAGFRAGLLPARKGAIAHFLLRNWLADTLE
ncbi:NAD(+) diphosphatase [Marivita sp. XM-24bin2]|uniref:NAD(+) diphosphatase n=1 Tax=unclassified Marivita TaxID=2632480 RepID=UPI000D78CD6D|nr:NAD(+) diphosphatase [Marivita sp. XM-24bin2]MCR9109360.1 NAD(+) diphosphatase [Paracoccaceae bacterium]PWL35466.1 MAG: NAD(+) diphosphatase [Marivita sp. XM-24bin2]